MIYRTLYNFFIDNKKGMYLYLVDHRYNYKHVLFLTI